MPNRYFVFPFTDEDNSSDGSPIPDRDKPFHTKTLRKKVELTNRMIGSFNVWMTNTERISKLLTSAFGSMLNITNNRVLLADFIYSMKEKLLSLLKWKCFLVFKRKVLVSVAAEKSQKVVVSNWTRRHAGDKA
jgi:hypothetical protein